MPKQTINIQRESNFELLRLFAMFCIVFYHLLFVIWYDEDAHSHGLLIALQSPFHIGVPLFVMISGYFKIKASWRGVAKLLLPLFIYFVPMRLYQIYMDGGVLVEYLKAFMFLSNTHYWFIQTYLWLFAISPALNMFIKDMPTRKRIVTIGTLAFITMYVGNFGNDPSLLEGKNVLHFALLYIIGDTLRVYRVYLQRVSWPYILAVYLILNVAVTCSYFWKQSIAMNMFFPYNSLGIIINCVLIFTLFERLQLKSQFVNYIASSSFIIYLLHGSPLFSFQMPTVIKMYHYFGYGFTFIISLLAFTVAIMTLAILIDKCLVPFYGKLINRF